MYTLRRSLTSYPWEVACVGIGRVGCDEGSKHKPRGVDLACTDGMAYLGCRIVEKLGGIVAVLCIVDSLVLVLDESGEDNRGEKVLYKGHRCGVVCVNGRENVLGGGKGRCREDIH